MSSRVTDKTISHWLIWARNFQEVVAYRVGEGRARRFRVRLPSGITSDGAPYRPKNGLFDITGHTAEDLVPTELMLTAREALVFAYGCAVGRNAALAGRQRWYEEKWTQQARDAYAEAFDVARQRNEDDMERESQQREAERQQRIAEYRRKRDAAQIDWP